MKKIGMLSFSRAINFGGLLQIYALQQTILKFNESCEVIDYRSPFLENSFHKSPFRSKYGMKRMISAFLHNSQISFPKKEFAKFIEENIKISNEVYNSSNISNANNKYDIFLTGSDQVWSYESAGFDKTYLLDFVEDNSKKHSYAASFGSSNIPEKYDSTYNKYIKTFERVSIRETSGTEYVKNKLGIEAQTDLDPTLLLDKNEWQKIQKKPKFLNDDDKYILIYMIAKSNNVINYAKHVAKKKGYKVVYINNNIFKTRGVINTGKMGPSEFIYLFLNAEHVITNSFHGVVFSINFEKSFLVELLLQNVKVNARLIDGLKLFGLDDLIIKKYDGLEFKSIDYSKVTKKLKKLRKQSIDYVSEISK